MSIWTSWCVLGCPRVSWGIKTDRENAGQVGLGQVGLSKVGPGQLGLVISAWSYTAYFAKPFLNFIDDTMTLISKFQVRLKYLLSQGLWNLNSKVTWCINGRRLLALIIFSAVH